MKTSQFKPLLPFALVLALFPSCSRRGAQNVRLQEQWNAKCQEAADLLAGVKDVPSARAAEPKLKPVLRELVKIDEQLQEHYDSEDVDAIDRKPMTEQAAKGIAEMQRLTAETLRISKSPELVAALGEAWELLPTVPMLRAHGAAPKSK